MKFYIPQDIRLIGLTFLEISETISDNILKSAMKAVAY